MKNFTNENAFILTKKFFAAAAFYLTKPQKCGIIRRNPPDGRIEKFFPMRKKYLTNGSKCDIIRRIRRPTRRKDPVDGNRQKKKEDYSSSSFSSLSSFSYSIKHSSQQHTQPLEATHSASPSNRQVPQYSQTATGSSSSMSSSSSKSS